MSQYGPGKYDKKRARRAKLRQAKRETDPLVTVCCSDGHERFTRPTSKIEETFGVMVKPGATKVYLKPGQFDCHLSNGKEQGGDLKPKATPEQPRQHPNPEQPQRQRKQKPKQKPEQTPEQNVSPVQREVLQLASRFRPQQTCVVVHNIHFYLNQREKDKLVHTVGSFRGRVGALKVEADPESPDSVEKLKVSLWIDLYPRRPEEGLEGPVHFGDVFPYHDEEPEVVQELIGMFKNEAGRFCVKVNRNHLKRGGDVVIGIKCKPGKCSVPCTYHHLRELEFLGK